MILEFWGVPFKVFYRLSISLSLSDFLSWVDCSFCGFLIFIITIYNFVVTLNKNTYCRGMKGSEKTVSKIKEACLLWTTWKKYMWKRKVMVAHCGPGWPCAGTSYTGYNLPGKGLREPRHGQGRDILQEGLRSFHNKCLLNQ